MNDKRAFVMDTNFIIEHRSGLRDVHQKLSETYDVFVSDISIQERISQKYLELRTKYDKIKKFKDEFKHLAKIETKRSFEKQYESERQQTQSGYKKLFGENIIQFVPDAEMLATIMDRVFKKTPPFINAENASDKGFKDTLLWLSLLGYFKDCSNDSVIFITNDRGFCNNSDALCKEFNECTGKTIEIRGNSFYNDLIKPNDHPKDVVLEPIPDITFLRERVQKAIASLCYREDEDYWGNIVWRNTFTLRVMVTKDDMQSIFTKLRAVIEENLFESALSADIALSVLGIIGELPIPIEDLQKALSLYEEICSKHQDYLQQFLSAASNIFNQNYKEMQLTEGDDNDLPF